MPFEQFDQQIADAAEKHHPVYHEEAWGLMNRMLNEHLPEDRKRKRRGLFILPLLLLLTAGGYFILKPGSGKPSLAANAEKTNEVSPSPVAANNATPAETPVNTVNSDVNGEVSETGMRQPENEAAQPGVGKILTNNNTETGGKASPLPVVSKKNKSRFSGPTASNNGRLFADGKINASAKKLMPANKKKGAIIAKNNKNRPLVETVEPPMKETVLRDETPTATTGTTNEVETVQPPQIPLPPLSLNEAKEESLKPATVNMAKKNPPKTPFKGNKFGRSFAVTISMGADMSAVHFSNPGSKRIITGVGLQYQVTRNITLRGGFLQTKKIYAAQPEDYRPKTSYTPPGYTLTSVDGDCRVFEFPVSVSYNFNPGKKWLYYAAAGVSSMMMKKEDYLYHYKTNWGQYRNYNYVLENKNDHLFSSIDLSVGIERKLGSHLFFRAEPYLRLPTRGIGYGNIHLKSAGILFMAGVKPFAKRNR
jgi:hypothetical protein